MKILKQGHRGWIGVAQKCPMCQCEFELDASDTVKRSAIWAGYTYPCPNCGNAVDLNSKLEA